MNGVFDKINLLKDNLNPKQFYSMNSLPRFHQNQEKSVLQGIEASIQLEKHQVRFHHGILPDWVFCPFGPQNLWELCSKLSPIICLRTTEKNCCLVPVLYKPLHRLHSNGCTFTRETDKLKILIINNCTVRHTYTPLCVYIHLEGQFFQQGNSSMEVLHLWHRSFWRKCRQENNNARAVCFCLAEKQPTAHEKS